MGLLVDIATGAFHVADKTKYDVTPDCLDDESDFHQGEEP